MAKHAEDLTIAPYDYLTLDGRDARQSALSHAERRRRLGLPRPAHASGSTRLGTANPETPAEHELASDGPFGWAVGDLVEGAGNNEAGTMLDTVGRLFDPYDSEAWVEANPLPKTLTFRECTSPRGYRAEGFRA